MEVVFTARAKVDIIFWQKNNIKIKCKIDSIIKDIIISPYIGIGKPEPLKHQYIGKWSRRTTKEHRLVYEVSGNRLIIHQCRYHY